MDRVEKRLIQSDGSFRLTHKYSPPLGPSNTLLSDAADAGPQLSERDIVAFMRMQRASTGGATLRRTHHRDWIGPWSHFSPLRSRWLVAACQIYPTPPHGSAHRHLSPRWTPYRRRPFQWTTTPRCSQSAASTRLTPLRPARAPPGRGISPKTPVLALRL